LTRTRRGNGGPNRPGGNTSTLQADVTGKVVKGPFLGDNITNKQQYAIEQGDCVTTPVTLISLSQLSDLVFSHA
jgi:hypothetical protein